MAVVGSDKTSRGFQPLSLPIYGTRRSLWFQWVYLIQECLILRNARATERRRRHPIPCHAGSFGTKQIGTNREINLVWDHSRLN